MDGLYLMIGGGAEVRAELPSCFWVEFQIHFQLSSDLFTHEDEEMK